MLIFWRGKEFSNNLTSRFTRLKGLETDKQNLVMCICFQLNTTANTEPDVPWYKNSALINFFVNEDLFSVFTTSRIRLLNLKGFNRWVHKYWKRQSRVWSLFDESSLPTGSGRLFKRDRVDCVNVSCSCDFIQFIYLFILFIYFSQQSCN